MKIGYICSDVDIDVCGHEGCSIHIREFVAALMEQGHEVFIICSWASANGACGTNAKLYPLKPDGHNAGAWKSLVEEPLILDNHLGRDMRSIFWNKWIQIEGLSILERERPDFLYERYALFGWGGLELSRRFHIPLLLELNAPLCDQQDGYREFVLTETARRMETQILRSADALIALTQWLADWAADRGARSHRIHILPDAVSDRLFGGAVSGHPVREKLGLLDKRTIGFLGSFHWWHDVGGLLEGFAHVFADDPSARLLLVGDGEERRALEGKARTLGLDAAVIFTGSVEHEEVPAYLAAMDVAVVPYRHIEDFFFSPMKLFECMAAARPTIAADLGQIAEIIDHAATGWLYPAGDNEKLVDGLKTLLHNPDLAARIGANAKRYVLGNHTWTKVTRDVVAVAEELIRARKEAALRVPS